MVDAAILFSWYLAYCLIFDSSMAYNFDEYQWDSAAISADYRFLKVAAAVILDL